MVTLAHVINPVHVPATSDLHAAQPVTFESMRIAQRFAAPRAAAELAVDLYAAHYAEDAPAAPADFMPLPLLERSVLDVGRFQAQRKLPLLADILERLYAAAGAADYLVYTNVDIALQPHFYLALARFIAAGHDAFVINRRTISARHTQIADLPQMWAEVGAPHRGWDCFVFPRALLPRFKLGHVCIGATRVGLALLANMAAYGRSFHEFTDAHLTFHIGDERAWLNPRFADYDAHNTRALLAILAALEAEVGPFDRRSIPGSFLLRRRALGPLYDRWARSVYLPPALSRALNRLLRGGV